MATHKDKARRDRGSLAAALADVDLSQSAAPEARRGSLAAALADIDLPQSAAPVASEPEPKPELVIVGCKIPKALHRQLKVLSVYAERNVQDIVQEALEDRLAILEEANAPPMPEGDAPEQVELVRMGVKLPKTLHRRLKLVSVLTERRMQDILQEAMVCWLNARGEKPD